MFPWFLLAATAWWVGCGRPTSGDASAMRLGAANSYLECAARDLLPTPLSFVRLAEPGMCPGHFDLRPSQVVELNQCRALLRFDFQNSLDGKLAGGPSGGPRIIEISVRGGLCQVASYVAVCERLSQAFVAEGLIERSVAEARTKSIGERVGSTAERLRQTVQAAGLSGLPVVASAHQKAFCEDLGLRVVASFRASDAARMSEVDETIATAEKSGAKWVVANLPEGRRLADALADRLKARVVVFGNFPDPSVSTSAFDTLLESNVNALVRAARP